ncbi:MAG: hypothetical protein ACJ72M_18095 [Propionibacteriaceae bacterium]
MSTGTLARNSGRGLAPDLGVRAGCSGVAVRRVPRAARRRHLDLPAVRVDPSSVPGGLRRVELQRMSAMQRAWLHTALERVHPGHDWISATE